MTGSCVSVDRTGGGNLPHLFVVMLEKVRFFFLLIVMFAFGCERNDGLSLPDGVLVRVGEEQLTFQQLEKIVDVRVKLARKQQPNMDDKSAAKFKSELRKNGVEKFKQDYVARICAREKGIEFADDACKKQLGRIFGGERKALSFVNNLTSDERFIVNDLVKADLLFAAINKKVADEAKILVAEDEIDAGMKKIADANALAQATNTLVYAQASNCWRRIVSGELTFLEASKQYDESGEHTDERIYWGEFPMSALTGDPALCAVLPQMNVGDVTPPIEADNALLIVQLAEVKQNEKKGAPLSPEAYYVLNRILFRLPLFYGQPSRDEVRQELLKIRRREVLKAFWNVQYSRYDFVERKKTKEE